MDNYRDLVFVSVAFGDERYLQQQVRLKESIRALMPDANILFYYDELPPGARTHNESHYGFKVSAISEARKKFTRVVWLDPAMILIDPDLSDLIQYPFAAVRDDHKLNPFISDQSLQHYGITRDQIADVHLVGGSLYYFDFDFQVVNHIFEMWMEAEQSNLFGSPRHAHTGATRGHRNDEALMALAMYKYGVHPVTHADIRYCIESNSMFSKKHFK